MVRSDNRKFDEKREVKITRNYTMYPDGCVLIESGNTKVICSAFIENRVPPFLRGEGTGWITCEYSMLPSSTQTRKQRDINRLKLDGRSSEIQRLIGRSLRSVVDLSILGEKTIMIDCDVIQADGGTRVASITGAFVALYDALSKMVEKGEIERLPLTSFLAAISVGIVENEPLLDLCYIEDSNAIVDMNVVMNEYGEFIELGMTGEKRPVKEEELGELLVLAKKGIKELIEIQREVLGFNN
ncbi:ribonuclease PH [Anaerofustis stercorihominis]|uniref:ribonuclease PH n=1 Tax=Anaerofustis stercorihominis TaxID=214853 RepID=UPI00214BB6C5|nr:ribonuclease PH [Anaerofustis stercorihominis]MCR2031959.1 ribonuclease PH [Anaerofustis stercorihominis]